MGPESDEIAESDILVAYRGSAWREIDGKYRYFWQDDPNLRNVRPVHDGQAPR